jgi:two-component sensor histidine kinase
VIPGSIVVWLKLEVGSLNVVGLGLFWLVSEETALVKRRYLLAFLAWTVLFAAFMVLVPGTLIWSVDNPRERPVMLPFGLEFIYTEVGDGPIVDLFYLSGFLLLSYLSSIVVRYHRSAGGRSSISLLWVLGIVSAAYLNDMAVSFGLYSFVYTTEYAWLASIFLTAHRRSSDLLYAETAREALETSEDSLRHRNEELAALNQIGQTLSRLAEPGRILEVIFEMIGRVMDNSNLFIALYDEERNLVSFPVYMMRGERVLRRERPFGNGITEHVIRTGSPFVANENLASVLELAGIELIGDLCLSFVAVPIRASDRVLGVLALQDYDREKAYDGHDIELLATIAAQASVALENARLYGAMQRELEERKRAEARILATLEERTTLLGEVHHRVKNNLQVIISLIEMKVGSMEKGDTRRFLEELEGQAHTMALVYEQLYQSESLSRIAMEPYLRQLTSNVLGIFGDSRSLRLGVEAPLSLDMTEAMPCGLIVNELFTNILKHAFPRGFEGEPEVDISMRVEGKACRLVVGDNGVGFPALPERKPGRGFGLRLVDLWATHQLGGSLEVDRAAGTRYTVIFGLKG